MIKQKRKHYYENVRGLGNVAVSRHAQERMDELDISHKQFEQILLENSEWADIFDGFDIIWRQDANVRIVIITPAPFRGAKLVKTVYKIKPQAKLR